MWLYNKTSPYNLTVFCFIFQRNGLFIEWKHVQDLYLKVTTMASHSKGLSLIPKLKFEHVNLTSCSKMRVDIAAQVSSLGLC